MSRPEVTELARRLGTGTGTDYQSTRSRPRSSAQPTMWPAIHQA